jgi:predicted heme/steroid binding protein
MSEPECYPLVEVAKHQARDDAWIVIDGKILDVTRFMSEHPGGEDIMLASAGRDASREFEEVGHSSDARVRLHELCIGTLRDATAGEVRLATNVPDGKANLVDASGRGLRDGLYSSGAKLWSLGVSSSSGITATRAGLAAGVLLFSVIVVRRLAARSNS